MHTYSSFHDAIIDLHRRGYVADFVLFGQELLWVQEKCFISENNFSITECHQFSHPYGKDEDLVIFGIQVSCQNIKGILMNHYSYHSGIPEVITKKQNEMGSYSSKNQARNYSSFLISTIK
jgi:hypothetical protein